MFSRCTPDSPTYAAGAPGSIFREDNPSWWNLSALGSILSYVSRVSATNLDESADVVVITSPFVYYGAPGTVSGLHREDFDTYAYSYNDGPSSKCWYNVAPFCAKKLEDALKLLFFGWFRKCVGANYT